MSFSASSINTEQGKPLQISVERVGAEDTATTVTVGYEILSGSAKENDDYTASAGTLTWQANDVSAKQINLAIAADPTNTEFKEAFFLRLYNPSNGATLSSPSYITVNIAGLVDKGAVSFIESSKSLAENQVMTAIEVSRDGSTSGELSVNYKLQSGSAIIDEDVEDISGTLTWAEGENENKVINLTLINDENEEETEQFSLLLETNDNQNLGANSTLVISILDDDNNTAPIANVIENFQVNTGQVVELTATATDNENDELSYLWAQTSGVNVTLNNPDKLLANFIAPSTAGELEFSFTVTDVKGMQGSDNITVSVIQAVAPVTPPVKKSSGGGSFGILLTLLSLLAALRLYKQPSYNS